MRAKAFTLVEMLMVLALSAIVVAMIWAVYANMNLFSLQYRKRLADSGRTIALDHYLRHDALLANDLVSNRDQACFEGDNFTGQTCYEFAADFTLRHHPTPEYGRQTNPDTIWISIRNWKIDSAADKKILRLTLAADEAEAEPRLNYMVQLPPSAKAQ